MTSGAGSRPMTVGELSRRTGLSVKNLRQYTDDGLIYAVGRSRSGYRLFDNDALCCVQLIGQLRGLGLTVAEIATATGQPATEVRQALEALPSLERDEQDRVVGYGLTLRPTPHRFSVDGQQLYTWCALDAVMFPGMLGRTAQVESPCHGTGTPVRLTIAPTGITHVAPATAVVSLVTPEDAAHIRTSLCNQVHFFASAEAATPWLDTHPGATVMPVHEAYDLGRELAQHFEQDTAPGACC